MGGGSTVPPGDRERRVEMIAAIMIAVTTVLTAWSAYQSVRWSGVQAESYVVASARRTESVRSANTANRQVLIDVQTFLDWLAARRAQDLDLADFIYDRMRDEFRVAFDAWAASVPAGEVPPGTPFELPEYQLAAQEEADRLEDEAAATFAEGREANQTGDNFVLAAVLFASVLFFAGLAGTFDVPKAQWLLLILGGVMFLGGAVVVVTLPQNVGF